MALVKVNVFSEVDFLPFATADLEKTPVITSNLNVSREKTPKENRNPQERTSQNNDTGFHLLDQKLSQFLEWTKPTLKGRLVIEEIYSLTEEVPSPIPA